MNETLERIIDVYADGKLVCDGCRKILSGKSTMSLLPDLWQIDIINVPAADLSPLKNSKISIAVGTKRDVLFSDVPVDVITRIESGKDYTSLFFMPGESFWRSTVNLSILSGSTVNNAISAILLQSGAFTAHMPDINKKIQRGRAYFGMAADAVYEITSAAGLRAWSVGDDIYAVQKGAGTKAFDIMETDIVGVPARIDGAIIIDMDARSAPVGRLASYSGSIYRITAVQISADTDSGDWFTTLTLTDEEKLTQAEWSVQ